MIFTLRFSLRSSLVSNNRHNDSKDNNSNRINFVYKWNNSKVDQYKQRLNSERFMKSMNDLTQSLDGSSDESISQNIESFSNILNNECKPLFGKRLHINSKLTAMGGQQEWFDNDCKTKRDEFYIDLNKYRSNKNEENRKKMCSTRSEYKKLLR